MITQGWDSITTLIDSHWIERRPRRPSVAPFLLMETRLMPWLAPQLPLAVPEPFVVSTQPLVVRHALVPGTPFPGPLGSTKYHHMGRQLGAFLRALHAADPTIATTHGLPKADVPLRSFEELVIPLIPASHHTTAHAVLAAAADSPTDTVVHGDLGPEHILTRAAQISGVIDFTDTHLGDPAIDLAWPLYGTPPAFADSLAAEYDITPELRTRAHTWHQLGPWHEVLHGLTTNDHQTVESGLQGVLSRLPR